MGYLSVNEIAKMLDHSLLKPEMTKQEIIDGCELAKQYGTASVCVRPCDVELAYGILQGSGVAVSTVIGFPHGSHLTEVKLFEAQRAVEAGCTELDMVLNIGRLRSGEHDYVYEDIKAIVDYAHSKNVLVKVILENAYLNDEQKIEACKICERAQADFVKTSSGYAPTGATVEDLKLMKANVSDSVKVKAAGGVRNLDAVLSCRALGCTRCGATATKAIIEEAQRRAKNCELATISADSAVIGTGY